MTARAPSIGAPIDADDPYASRCTEEPRLVARQDPVVYEPETAADRGPLNVRQLGEYERHGFTALPGAFSPQEVEVFHAELERMAAEAEDADREEFIREPGSRTLRSVFCIHRLSPVFAKLITDYRLAGAARQILNGDVYVHQSRINIKPGFEGREFWWHSDFETWHMEDGMPRMRALSCIVTLTENTPYNGALMMIPGSHRDYVCTVGETPEDHYRQSLRKQETGVPDKNILQLQVEAGGLTAPTGPPGTLVIFDCNTMHGSAGNMTPLPRSNVFFVFNSVENSLRAPYCGRKPRPLFVASRDFTPVEVR